MGLSVTPLATQVYELLLHKIASGELRPGHVLVEQELSDQLGVSRTPVREAILRLTEYGVVENAGRSARVRQLTPQDVTDLFQVRRALELEAVRLACRKFRQDDFDALDAADPKEDLEPAEFARACQQFDWLLHRTIAERSGNPLLAYKIRKLHDRVQLVCKHSVERLHEHRAIVAALKTGDVKAARQAMHRHLMAAYREQLRLLRTTNPPTTNPPTS